MTINIIYSNERGYITLEQTGKSQSYVIWLHNGTSAIRRHTLGSKIPNALERAKDKLQNSNGL